MTRKILFVTLILLLTMVSGLSVTLAFARGIFDVECTVCSGTGKIGNEITCPNCNGSGRVTVLDQYCGGTGKVVHTSCNGTGKITVKNPCFTCFGLKKVSMIFFKDDRGTMTALPMGLGIAHIEGVFHNAYYRGVNVNVTASVETIALMLDYRFEKSVTVYLPPNEDVTVKIDVGTSAEPIVFEKEWKYSVFISSSEGDVHSQMIACPDCNGTGLRNVSVEDPVCDGTGLVDCPKCNGTGKIDVVCENCAGSGRVVSEGACPRCGGLGYLTDWTRFGVTSTVGLGAILSLSFLVAKREKRSLSK